MPWPHIHMAVVGHTNTGKTSMIRTLLRQTCFGEVKDQAGTTQSVNSASLFIDGESAMTLYDSPGLENAPGVYDWLTAHASHQRHQGLERLRVLFDDDEARDRFWQEITVLELLISSDIALYVADAREPVLEKYRDELSLLAMCGKPIVVVLNFVASKHSQEDSWRSVLAELGHHHLIAFDAVVRNPATEQRLFEKIRSLLDQHTSTIDAWLSLRERQEAERLLTSLRALADMLMSVHDQRWIVKSDQDMTQILDQLRDDVKRREQACVQILLDLYQFESSDYDAEPLTLKNGRWQEDLFDPETLKAYGLRAGRYIGTGASIGAVFDVATAGLSLGTGTLSGAVIGGTLSAITQWGHQGLAKVRGEERLRVDQSTLRLLSWRQMALLRALRRRGHASQRPLSLLAQDVWQSQPLPKGLSSVRLQPSERRVSIVNELAVAFVED